MVSHSPMMNSTKHTKSDKVGNSSKRKPRKLSRRSLLSERSSKRRGRADQITLTTLSRSSALKIYPTSMRGAIESFMTFGRYSSIMTWLDQSYLILNQHLHTGLCSWKHFTRSESLNLIASNTKHSCSSVSKIVKKSLTNSLIFWSQPWSIRWSSRLIETVTAARRKVKRALSRIRLCNESTKSGSWSTLTMFSSTILSITVTSARWRSL